MKRLAFGTLLLGVGCALTAPPATCALGCKGSAIYCWPEDGFCHDQPDPTRTDAGPGDAGPGDAGPPFDAGPPPPIPLCAFNDAGMPRPRAQMSVVTDPDGGGVYLIGGLDSRGLPSAAVDVFLDGGWFGALGGLALAVSGPTATLCTSGLCVIGGRSAQGVGGDVQTALPLTSPFVDATTAFDSSAARYVPAAPVPTALAATALVAVDSIWVVGGVDDAGAVLGTSSVFYPRPAENSWAPFSTTALRTPRFAAATVVDPDQSSPTQLFHVIGGFDASGVGVQASEGFDDKSDQASTTSDPLWDLADGGRGGLSVVAGADGLYYAIGGSASVDAGPVSQVQALNPSNLLGWQPAPALHIPRIYAAAFAVGQRIFVAGGFGLDGGLVEDVEVLDLSLDGGWQFQCPHAGG